MSSDGAAAATADVDGHYRPSSSKHSGSKTPPTPPGSPIDRPFPAATLPPPGGKTVLQMIREEGDGCRRGKSSSRTAKKSASHQSTNAGTDRAVATNFCLGVQSIHIVFKVTSTNARYHSNWEVSRRIYENVTGQSDRG